MRVALYYPHTQIRDESLLKNALLLWDHVDYISPNPQYKFGPPESATVSEALEILCRPVIPTRLEKELVHERVHKLLEHGTPNWLVFDAVPDELRNSRPVREFYGNSYGMYPDKLLDMTWRTLARAGLVRLNGHDDDYYARPLVGFLLMSLLADACAGTQKEKITDRTEAYQFLWSLASKEAQDLAESQGKNTAKADTALERLVALSVRALNTDSLDLTDLVELRKREGRQGGHHYRGFREKYAREIKACVNQLVNQAKSLSDWNAIEESFHLTMKDDLASLRDELSTAKRSLVFSKPVLTAVAASASLFAEPVSSSVILAATAKAIAGGALATEVIEFSGDYKKALEGHAMSWLYLAQSPKRRSAPFGDLAA